MWISVSFIGGPRKQRGWLTATSSHTDQKQIAKDSDEYRKFKDRAGLSESNFALAQLFIDSSCGYIL